MSTLYICNSCMTQKGMHAWSSKHSTLGHATILSSNKCTVFLFGALIIFMVDSGQECVYIVVL